MLKASPVAWTDGGLVISKLQALIKKDIKKFPAAFFSSVFGHQNPGTGLDQDPESMNPDPQLWFFSCEQKCLGHNNGTTKR
jgi:hypothetical protein